MTERGRAVVAHALAQAALNVGGYFGAAKIAADFQGELSRRKVRFDLPPACSKSCRRCSWPGDAALGEIAGRACW